MEERIKTFQITPVKVMHPGFVSVGFHFSTLILLLLQWCYFQDLLLSRSQNVCNDLIYYPTLLRRVQISHDICTHLIPPGRVKFKTLASQNFGKRNCWIINLLLDVLVCSIAVYFYSLFVF